MLEHPARADVLSHLFTAARARLCSLAGIKAVDDPLLGNRDNPGDRVNVIASWQEASWPPTGSWNILLTARTAAGL